MKSDLEEILNYVIPWANFEVDEDAHRDYMESIWADECYMGYDKEDDPYHYSQPFNEWYQSPQGIVPCGSDGGEVEHYRLTLSLNEIGEAFLIINKFLTEYDILLEGPG